MTGPEFKVEVNFSYDRDRGELVETETLLGREVKRVTEVRAKLVEDITRQAVILELERLGYTVISPDS